MACTCSSKAVEPAGSARGQIAEVKAQTGSAWACEVARFACNRSTFPPAYNVAVGFFLSPASISNFRTFFPSFLS